MPKPKIINPTTENQLYLDLQNDPDPIATLSKQAPLDIKNCRSPEGENLLHIAIQRNNPRLFKWLLEHHGKALIESKSIEGETPLHFAVIHGDPVYVALLCMHGAKINAYDRQFRTPLEYAKLGLIGTRHRYLNEPADSVVPMEMNLIQIIYWLIIFCENIPQNLYRQPFHQPDKIIAHGKNACLPPYPVKDQQLLTNDKLLLRFIGTINRYKSWAWDPRSFSGIRWKRSLVNRTRICDGSLADQFVAKVLTFLIILSLKSDLDAHFILGKFLDYPLTEEKLPEALDSFGSRWIEYLLLRQTRKIYDQFPWPKIKVNPFNWKSTVAIDDAAYDPNQSDQKTQSTMRAKQALQHARTQIRHYYTQQYSIITMGEQDFIKHILQNQSFKHRESLASKCMRTLITTARKDKSDTRKNLQYAKWCLLFSNQLADIVKEEEAEEMILVGTSDGRVEEYRPVKP